MIDVGRGRRLLLLQQLQHFARAERRKKTTQSEIRRPSVYTMEKDSLGHGRIWAKCTPSPSLENDQRLLRSILKYDASDMDCK